MFASLHLVSVSSFVRTCVWRGAANSTAGVKAAKASGVLLWWFCGWEVEFETMVVDLVSIRKLCRGCCWGGETTPTTPPIYQFSDRFLIFRASNCLWELWDVVERVGPFRWNFEYIETGFDTCSSHEGYKNYHPNPGYSFLFLSCDPFYRHVEWIDVLTTHWASRRHKMISNKLCYQLLLQLSKAPCPRRVFVWFVEVESCT